jgi:hypothetical protein
MLRDNAVIPAVPAKLQSRNFYFDAHQRVYRAILELHAGGKPVDTTILFESLRKCKQLEDVGGAAYLAELWDAAPTSANWSYYADIVRDKATARDLIHEATELARDAADGVTSAADLLARAERKLREIIETHGVGRAAEKGLQRVRYADVRAVLADIYLVKGLLSKVGMSVIFGPSGSGKSFLALDVALRVAAGGPWRGRRVSRGAVLYIAAEAGGSALNRVEAFKRETGLTALPFDLVPCAVNLLDPASDVDRVIDSAKASAAELGVSPSLVIIDTLSRAFGGGDENGSVDMGGFVRNVDRIRDALGSHISIIHHSGKDITRGARGHTSLYAAADTVVEVSADAATGLHTAKVVKQRDGETGAEYPFRLKVVELGTDEDGDPVTSCVVVEADATPANPRAVLTSDQRAALNVLTRLVAFKGREEPGTPVGRRVVTIGEWWESFYAQAKSGAKPATKRQAFRRASSELIAGKHAFCLDPFVWPADEPDPVTGVTNVTKSRLTQGPEA